MKKYLGIDYGDVRTGLAVNDSLGLIASGIGNVTAGGPRKLAIAIAQICKERGIEEIILGHPINMNGTLGPRSELVRSFAGMLEEETGLPVTLFDERCTTMVAHSFLSETGTRGKKRRQVVDTLSAQIILQNYMDMIRAKDLTNPKESDIIDT